jgi:hypothetical protein
MTLKAGTNLGIGLVVALVSFSKFENFFKFYKKLYLNLKGIYFI